jgi:hypothetical protein
MHATLHAWLAVRFAFSRTDSSCSWECSPPGHRPPSADIFDGCCSRIDQYLAWRVMHDVSTAELGISGHQSKVDGHLQVVELELHPPEPWNDAGRDLLTEVADAQRATQQDAEKSAHEKDQYQHRHRPNI